MTRYAIAFISLAFLIYGGVRLGVSSLMLMHIGGLINLPDLQDALNDVNQFMQMTRDQALFPVTAGLYLAYLWVMGVLLVTGAVGCFRRKAFGHVSLFIFLGLYVLLFINFQTINPKVIHPIVCALLLAIYLWLMKKERTSVS